MRDRFFGHGRWYYTLAVISLGLLAWVPFLHAGVKLKDGRQKRRALFFGATAVVLLAISGASPDSESANTADAATSPLDTAVAVGVIVTVVVACILLRPLRAAVWPGPVAVAAPPRAPLATTCPSPIASETAVNQALAARQRRADARALVERDPALARDLGIGRPDLPRSYDDGGLVDLNGVSAEMLHQHCGISLATAERIVERREIEGGFSLFEEITAHVDLNGHDEALLRDRAIIL